MNIEHPQTQAKEQQQTASGHPADPAAESLRASEARFRAISQSANDAIISADADGRIVSWNTGARAIFGYEQEEVVGQSLTLLMPESFREAHRNGLRRFLTTGIPQVIGTIVEVQGLRKDGSEFPLELSLATWETGQGRFFGGIIRDITQRRRSEDIIRASEHRFRTMAETIPAMVAIYQGTGHVYVNPATETMLGYTADELLQRSFLDYVHRAGTRKGIELVWEVDANVRRVGSWATASGAAESGRKCHQVY
jgi:PAS domain S-box-containing protein